LGIGPFVLLPSFADGYWFEPPSNPRGPSFTTGYCPINMPLGQFHNNSAHSNGVQGLRVYPAYFPFERPCDPTSRTQPQFFTNFTAASTARPAVPARPPARPSNPLTRRPPSAPRAARRRLRSGATASTASSASATATCTT
jgi:hypothetical protein